MIGNKAIIAVALAMTAVSCDRDGSVRQSDKSLCTRVLRPVEATLLAGDVFESPRNLRKVREEVVATKESIAYYEYQLYEYDADSTFRLTVTRNAGLLINVQLSSKLFNCLWAFYSEPDVKFDLLSLTWWPPDQVLENCKSVELVARVEYHGRVGLIAMSTSDYLPEYHTDGSVQIPCRD